MSFTLKSHSWTAELQSWVTIVSPLLVWPLAAMLQKVAAESCYQSTMNHLSVLSCLIPSVPAQAISGGLGRFRMRQLRKLSLNSPPPACTAEAPAPPARPGALCCSHRCAQSLELREALR